MAEYNFQGFGGVGDAIANALLQQQQLRRQAILDDINQRRQQQDLVNAQMQAQALSEQRDALASQRNGQAAAATASMLQPGQPVSDTDTSRLQLGGLGSLINPAVPSTIANVEQQPTQIGPGLLQQGPGPTLGTATFRGTPQQLQAQQRQAQLDQYLADPNTPDVVKQFISAQRASGDNSLPPDLFKPPKPTTEPVMRVNPRTGQVEQIGSIPTGSHVVQTPTRDPLAEALTRAELAKATAGPDQGKLEQQYRTQLARVVSNRSGGLGLEDQKVNQANHLTALMDQYNGKAMPANIQNELALGLARLVSPSGQVGLEIMRDLNQRTAQGGIASAVSYLTGDPTLVNATPEKLREVFRDSITRQGQIAVANREGEMNYLRGLAPTDLDEGRRKQLESSILNPLMGSGGSSSTTPVEKWDFVNGKLQRVQQ